MADTFLTTTGNNAIYRYSADDYMRMMESAELDRFQEHRLVDDPDLADLILFVGALEPDHLDVRRHPLVRRYPERCFLYDAKDRIFPFLPGVYPSLRAQYAASGRAVSGGYTAVLHVDLQPTPFDEAADHLFSFSGSFVNHPVRRSLAELADHPRGLIRNTADLPQSHAPGEHRDRYSEDLARSKFILCPRGVGPGSWRIFETMKAGRVPVIVSDQWVPPRIDRSWDSFSVRVSESDVGAIPDMLEEREARAPGLARRARKVWEDWFAAEAFYHRTVEWCLEIMRSRPRSERVGRIIDRRRLLWPGEARRFVLPRVKKMVEGLIADPRRDR